MVSTETNQLLICGVTKVHMRACYHRKNETGYSGIIETKTGNSTIVDILMRRVCWSTSGRRGDKVRRSFHWGSVLRCVAEEENSKSDRAAQPQARGYCVMV